jgi:hypothetical protein
VAFFHKETLTFTANSLEMLNASFLTPLPATGMALPPGNAMPVCVAVFLKSGASPVNSHIEDFNQLQFVFLPRKISLEVFTEPRNVCSKKEIS